MLKKIDKKYIKKRYNEVSREKKHQPFGDEILNNYDYYLRKKLIDKYMNYCLKHGATSFLDVGCADGLYVFDSLKMGYMKSVGVDISDNAVKRAIQKSKTIENWKNVKFKIADAEKLPFDDNSFDVILCSETLEHLLEPVTAIKELQRISKKFVIISVPTGIGVPWIKYGRNLIGKPFKIDKDITFKYDGHLHYYTAKSLLGMLIKNKLEPINYCGCPILGLLLALKTRPILTKIFSPLDLLLSKIFPEYGATTIVLCKKNGV